MAQQDMVTLEHPDGRRYRTDNASEINLLTGSYGYRRVEQENAKSRSSKHTAPRPSTPSSSPETPPSSEASSS